MKKYFKLSWVFGLLVLITGSLMAKSPAGFLGGHDEKGKREELVKKLLNVTNQTSAVTTSIIDSIEAVKKNASPSQVDLLNADEKEINKSAKDLEAKIVTIYASHFTSNEIEGILEFFKTPVGSKFISEQTAIQTEIAAAAQVWSQNIQQKLANDLAQQ